MKLVFLNCVLATLHTHFVTHLRVLTPWLMPKVFVEVSQIGTVQIEIVKGAYVMSKHHIDS